MCLTAEDDITIPIHKILPFANVDGIGNRTSLFVQGCNISCVYCHNPETISCNIKPQQFMCLNDIINEVKIYKPYIRGITVSGGEPTLYFRELAILFQKIHTLDLTCYIDTNGFFNSNTIGNLITQTDKFLFDIKTLSKGKEMCHTSKTSNLENLAYLLDLHKIEEVRTVCLKEPFSDVENVVEKVATLLKNHPGVQYKLIKVHARGVTNQQFIQDKIPTNKEMNIYATIAKNNGAQNIRVIL